MTPKQHAALALGVSEAELTNLYEQVRLRSTTMNMIVSRLLPEHRGKYICFNHRTGEFKVVESETEAKTSAVDVDCSWRRIEERPDTELPTTH